MLFDFICRALALTTFCFEIVSDKHGYGPGAQDWGYIDVREGAHMFYWLFYTTAGVSNYTDRPLTIWLQGGPGQSSTGFGNFEELGPLDLFGNPRNHTWVKHTNVLFIDSPVGSGFSYVDHLRLLATTNKDIAHDLIVFMKNFYKLHPEFEMVPLHIFCESYGGRMGAEFALDMNNAIEHGELRSTLKSVVLISPWISPIDATLAYGPYMLKMGIVDEIGYENVMNAVDKIQELIKVGEWVPAFSQLQDTFYIMQQESKGVSFYNILNRTRFEETFIDPTPLHEEERTTLLQNIMRGSVRGALNAKTTWYPLNVNVFNSLKYDFMKPYMHIVRKLLDSTELQVGVVSGQLDLITSTVGTVNWINKMQWNRKSAYEAAPRLGIYINGILEGYEKTTENFNMFWINRAGHHVPLDNPDAMIYLLKRFIYTGIKKKKIN